jgi:hypothetical protein
MSTAAFIHAESLLAAAGLTFEVAHEGEGASCSACPGHLEVAA